MYKGKKVGVLVTAAGSGSRMNSEIPKQFMHIDGEPMLVCTCRRFSSHPLIDFMVVTANHDYMKETAELLSEVPDIEIQLCPAVESSGKAAYVVAGGASRQESVHRGLEFIHEFNLFSSTEGSGILLIHDGARPFVSEETITACIAAAADQGACTAAVRPKNTIRTADRTLDRSSLYEVHTPQGFDFQLILEAHRQAEGSGFGGTDDVSLTERLGCKTEIVMDEYSNTKVTTPEDLPRIPRMGQGIDYHRLVEDRPLILGGVEIPYEKGLLGHSDADVLVHAVMDALLGAAALGDIGKLFPDTDPAYKGADSLALLKEVAAAVRSAGYRIGNIDATLIAQRPKVAGCIEQMRSNLAEACDIMPQQVNVKATTTEKMGFAGRGEGMAAEAVSVLY